LSVKKRLADEDVHAKKKLKFDDALRLHGQCRFCNQHFGIPETAVNVGEAFARAACPGCIAKMRSETTESERGVRLCWSLHCRRCDKRHVFSDKDWEKEREIRTCANCLLAVLAEDIEEIDE
jgi:hypothetical protein